MAEEKCRVFKENHFNRHKRTGIVFPTVSMLIKEWFDQKRLVHKESTQANYRAKASKHIIPAFDGVLIQDLSHREINDFAIKLAKKGLSVNYVRSIMVLFKSILNYGVRAYGLNISLDLIELPSKQFKEKDIYSHDEAAALFRTAVQLHTLTSVAVVFALGFGLRIGEICGLKWSDIDLDGKIIHVRRTVQRVGCRDENCRSKVMCGDPKSKSSIRDIIIPDRLCSILKILKSDGNSYIVSGKETFIEPRTLQYRYKAFVKSCGVRYLSFHSLRHYKATANFENGVEDLIISKALGHSSLDVTNSIYIHSRIGQQRKYADLMDIPEEFIA